MSDKQSPNGVRDEDRGDAAINEQAEEKPPVKGFFDDDPLIDGSTPPLASGWPLDDLED